MAWSAVRKQLKRSLAEAVDEQEFFHAIFRLAAYADEACKGVGNSIETHRVEDDGQESDDVMLFWLAALDQLAGDQEAATLGREVDASVVRVLPKMHTPQNGLTIRSLTLNLALVQAGEIIPTWISVGNDRRLESLNLLLIPWPWEVLPTQFEQAEAKRDMRNMDPKRFGFFSYRHFDNQPDDTRVGVVEHAKRTLVAARREVGRIDALILPELALTETELFDLLSLPELSQTMLIAGWGKPSENGEPGLNEVAFSLPGMGAIRQGKHHRWKLDAQQLRQYGLASQLSIGRDWWEFIDLNRRDFVLNLIAPDMVLAALICEDLARPDPVGDLLRAVGPNLIISLLADGPQLRSRWPSRYAMVLSDDPGASVLSVTSLGMVKMSRSLEGRNSSRVVALWKDRLTGGPHEIELADDAAGVVLTIATESHEEWTADGRSDSGRAIYPTLAGVRNIRK